MNAISSPTTGTSTHERCRSDRRLRRSWEPEAGHSCHAFQASLDTSKAKRRATDGSFKGRRAIGVRHFHGLAGFHSTAAPFLARNRRAWTRSQRGSSRGESIIRFLSRTSGGLQRPQIAAQLGIGFIFFGGGLGVPVNPSPASSAPPSRAPAACPSPALRSARPSPAPRAARAPWRGRSGRAEAGAPNA